ncbi:sigma-70 family RNA polymerase sigma factor [Streptomyces sp. NPDC047070]|uniref:sigma-70 family RNA polymerase sigma factor n=1 Tax=Streptomyces sp. NPDC047070 TaxID=3154923 RepID=UPI003454B09C
MMTELPAPFANLAHLSADPTVEQVRALTLALKAVPDLQKWLRHQREITTRGLLDGGKTAAELAPVMEVGKQRVYDIASGHVNSATLARRAKAKAEAEAEAEAGEQS